MYFVEVKKLPDFLGLSSRDEVIKPRRQPEPIRIVRYPSMLSASEPTTLEYRRSKFLIPNVFLLKEILRSELSGTNRTGALSMRLTMVWSKDHFGKLCLAPMTVLSQPPNLGVLSKIQKSFLLTGLEKRTLISGNEDVLTGLRSSRIIQPNSQNL